MYMNTNYINCMYINPEKENAVNMINPCLNGINESYWSCVGPTMIDQSALNWTLERPSGDNVSKPLPHSLQEETKKVDKPTKQQKVEGFTNLGKSYVPSGQCPDGYIYDRNSNKCKQVCQNCKFNETNYFKSKEFNEYDGCFPDQGVYAGIDNQGYTLCTCGKDEQYCGNIFDAQGGMYYDKAYIMNVGDYGFLGNMASY